jgi:hypothetical protein
MSKRVILVGLSAIAIMLGTNCATLAADDCLAAPSRPPAPGGHWYYHVDRTSDRKCWYLVEPGALTQVAPTPTAQAPQPLFAPEPPPPPAQPSFGSFFSSLGLAPAPNTTGDARVQPAPADDPRNGEAEPSRPSRMVLATKQHRSVHLRPPAEHAEERPAASLNQTERDALFAEFLKWRERQ